MRSASCSSQNALPSSGGSNETLCGGDVCTEGLMAINLRATLCDPGRSSLEKCFREGILGSKLATRNNPVDEQLVPFSALRNS